MIYSSLDLEKNTLIMVTYAINSYLIFVYSVTDLLTATGHPDSKSFKLKWLVEDTHIKKSWPQTKLNLQGTRL